MRHFRTVEVELRPLVVVGYTRFGGKLTGLYAVKKQAGIVEDSRHAEDMSHAYVETKRQVLVVEPQVEVVLLLRGQRHTPQAFGKRPDLCLLGCYNVIMTLYEAVKCLVEADCLVVCSRLAASCNEQRKEQGCYGLSHCHSFLVVVVGTKVSIFFHMTKYKVVSKG